MDILGKVLAADQGMHGAVDLLMRRLVHGRQSSLIAFPQVGDIVYENDTVEIMLDFENEKVSTLGELTPEWRI